MNTAQGNMDKLLFSLTLIGSGLALGYLLQQLDRASIISLPLPLIGLRKLLQKIGLLFFMPVSFLAAVWTVSFDNLRVALLPVIGTTALIGGGLLGLLFARILNKPAEQRAVLFCCGSFSNLGAIGSLICFMFLGEAGFALVALYRMIEEIYYYAVGFPLARFISGSHKAHQSLGRRLVTVLTDPFVAAALSAFFIGLSLNLTGIARPPVFIPITAWFVPAGTFVLIVSIGLGMRFSGIRASLIESLGVSLIKCLAVPLFSLLFAYLCGLHRIDGGLPFKVVLVLSAMPVAFNALVAASIYDLDLDLANSCWLMSTSTLLVVIPGLYLLLRGF